MQRVRVAVVGDFDADKIAHQAIEACFRLAEDSASLPVEQVWMATQSLVPGNESAFRNFHGVWSAPGSPYRNTEGALWAITYARTTKTPFLGTCGGVQHALLEYVRNVLGLREANHAENNPETDFPLLRRMQCSLVAKSQKIVVVSGTRFGKLYGADSALEDYHCSYGLNPKFEHLFRRAPLEIVARSEDGGVRAVALRGHPFFIGTLFQPERKALTGVLHPVVDAFFAACADNAVSSQQR
jgi:CTP synthase (UTP-ammonia lyase)